ncbi:ankyrin repeat domain-containing protein [Legionella fallonii]|uniref:ankyrin repeat domain-containing protein n=1 Tax=Legionella fallonii TaxID=96230 RepID=UPI00155B2C25|nr:ankyrin repeat domain-containing protein [Legionella fallonii]
MTPIHRLLISLRESLGYFKSPLGCCHGFSVRWLEGYLVGEGPLFEKRLNDIYSYSDTFIHLFNDLKEKKGLALTEEDRKLLDIHAFLDHLELQQSPEQCTLLFGKYLFQTDIDSISNIATSDTMRHHGGLHTLYSKPGIYTTEEIKKYLDEFITTIDHSPVLLKETLGITLSGIDHTVALLYRPQEGWTFMDINNYPSITFSKDETRSLSEKIANALKLNPSDLYTAFNTSVFTTGNNVLLPELKTVLEQFQKKQIFTKEMFARECNDYDLAYIALVNKHVSVLQEYIKYGFRLDKCYNQSTMLNLAIIVNAPDIIELLCDNGITLNASNSSSPPVYLAAYSGNVDAIDTLSQRGADLHQANEHGFTPCYIATCMNYVSAIIALARHGANLNLGDLNKGSTPLHAAVDKGLIQAIDALIKHGANPDYGDNNKATPFHIAAEKNNVDIIIMLDEYGANLDLGDNTDSTPLHIAVVKNNIQAISALLNCGANPNKADQLGFFPIHIAASYDDVDVINELVQHHAHVEAKNNDGFTPMHCAAENNFVNSIGALHQLGANINSEDNQGNTPLHIAINEGCTEAVIKLAGYGADVNKKDSRERPPVFFCNTKRTCCYSKRINRCRSRYFIALYNYGRKSKRICFSA